MPCPPCLVAFAVLLAGQTGETPSSVRQEMPAASESAAVQTLDQARRQLLGRRSLRATLVQRVDFAGRRFESSGDYLAGDYPRMRMRLRSNLRGQSLDFLAVCDGQVLWTVRSLHLTPVGTPEDPETVDRQVARYDIDRLLAREGGPGSLAQQLRMGLAVGGLPALLAGLQESFDWAELVAVEGQVRMTGRWKPGALERHGVAGKTPLTLPTLVELTLDQRTLVPLRVFYHRERRRDDGTTQRLPVLLLELQDITLDEPIAADAFRYTPPEDTAYEDRTKATLDTIDAL